MEKTCTKCGETKTIDLFYKQKRGLYGVKSFCKKCSINATSEWIKINREKVRDNASKNRLRPERKEKRNNYLRGYYQTNKGKFLINQNNKNWVKKNIQKVREQSKLIKKRQVENLEDAYIKNKLKTSGWTEEYLNNQDLIDCKRLIIKTKRLCKTLAN